MKIQTIAVAAALTACAAVTVATAGSSGAARPAKWVDGHYVAQTARGEAAGQIVRKWSAYVQKIYGVAPQKWARSMAASFAQADVHNMQRAAKMETYEAMMATLLGQRVTDEQIIDKLARSDGSIAAAQLLGSPSSDLVYTAIEPCRIADTRVTGGPIEANATRDFDSSGYDFTAQGGASSDCGLPADAAAILVNVTAVFPTAPGFLTIYPFGTAMPLASALNYASGEIKGNLTVVKQTAGMEHDFSVYAYGGTDVVIDVAGYFMAPVATAMDCITVNGTQSQVANNATFTVSATCSTGYAVTGGGLRIPGNSAVTDVHTSESYPQASAWFVNGRNSSGSSQTVQVRAQCCRVPGR